MAAPLQQTQSQYINETAAAAQFGGGGGGGGGSGGPTPVRSTTPSQSFPPSGSQVNDEESGHRFGALNNNTGNNPNTSSGEFPSATAERRMFLKLANEVSFGKLENHLREYVRSIPFRPAPTYVGPAGKMPPPARPSKFREDWDQVFERDPAQQDILEHSASFRYCTQRLAMGFHSPYERDRQVIDYKTFSKVLAVPNPTNYESLDPHVEDIPENELAESPSNSATLAGSPSGLNASPNSGLGTIAQSKFLAQRLAAAKKKGVQLKMSKTDVSKELARMDMEDKQDEEIDAQELLNKRQAERDAQREAERKKKEKEDAQKGRPQVVNMYDLPDWRHATGRCHVTTMQSWRTAKSAYF